MNFTHKHAEHSKINNYKSVYVGNDAKYIKLCWHEEYDLFFTVDDFIKWIIGNKMKFYKVIMNPPYNKDLHLKILKEVLLVCPDAEVVCLHPAPLFNDPRLAFMDTQTLKRFADIFERCSSASFIDVKTATELFNSGFFQKLVISCYDRKLHSKDRTRFLDKKLVPISCKIMNKAMSDNLKMHVSSKRDGEFSMPISGIHGNMTRHDGYNVLGLDYDEQCNSKVEYKFVNFATENERRNFYDAMMLPAMIYINHLWKSDQHVNMQYIPWLGDYTSLWTNERLYKYFNLTDDEIKYIEDTCK
jgi:hypothetical protein